MSELTDERKIETIEKCCKAFGWEPSSDWARDKEICRHGKVFHFDPFESHDDAQLLIDECERRGLMERVSYTLWSETPMPEKENRSWDEDEVNGITVGLLATAKQKTLAVLVVVEQLKRKDGD